MDNATWVVLDALRRKRNGNDYTGDVVTPDMVTECVTHASRLRSLLRKQLTTNYPQLLKQTR